MDKAGNQLATTDGYNEEPSIFDSSPSGGLKSELRGYDRAQVEQVIREKESLTNKLKAEKAQLDQQVRKLREKYAEASTKLREAEQPTYTGLGARIEHLLRLAEEQAGELVGQAEGEASELRAEAKVDAAELRSAAENDAEEMRASAKREAD
jgi:hypothetical protein